MTDHKILITDGLDESGQAILRAFAWVDDRSGISAEELLKIIHEYDALIVRGRTKVTASVLQAGSRLKVVGCAGVGVNNIDLEAAKSRGVTVVNAPISTPLAVAELTFGLLLALAALDVFMEEPAGKIEAILRPRVIATPHIGAQTVEAQFRGGDDIASDVLNVLKGNPLRLKVA